MLADFFTKPLQGELFRRFRDVIIRHKDIDTLLQMEFPKTTSKERVEESRSTDTKQTDEDDISMTEGPRKGPRKPNWADVVRGKKIE